MLVTAPERLDDETDDQYKVRVADNVIRVRQANTESARTTRGFTAYSGSRLYSRKLDAERRPMDWGAIQ